MQRHFLLITVAVFCIEGAVIFFKRPSQSLADFTPWQKLIRPFPTRIVGDYEAPLQYYDSPNREPHKYFVYLHHGHSLVQHKEVVSDDAELDSAITNIFPGDSDRGPYYAAGLHDAALAAVRADIGVDLVQCLPKVYLID